MTLDLTPVVQPLIILLGMVITGLITIYVPKAIAAFEQRTGVQFTEQQRQTMLGAVRTAAGVLETRLDQGLLKVGQINQDDANVRAQAQAAISAVPDAATKLDMTVDGVARMIVGAVDTAKHEAKAAS